MKSAFAQGDKFLVSVLVSQSFVTSSTILLCSCTKSVCMEVSAGCSTALVSPLVRSLGVGFGFGFSGVGCGLANRHCFRLGRALRPFVLWVLNPAPGKISPPKVSSTLRPLATSSVDPQMLLPSIKAVIPLICSLGFPPCGQKMSDLKKTIDLDLFLWFVHLVKGKQSLIPLNSGSCLTSMLKHLRMEGSAVKSFRRTVGLQHSSSVKWFVTCMRSKHQSAKSQEYLLLV